MSHGKIVREITEEEFYIFRVRMARALSGFGMLLYFGLAISSYSPIVHSFAGKGSFLSFKELSHDLDHKELKIRRNAIQKLQGVTELPSINLLFKACRDSDGWVRHAAIKILHQKIRSHSNKARFKPLFGPNDSNKKQMMSIFVKALDDEIGSVRKEASLGLGKLSDIRVLPYLFRALKDQNQSVRENALIALQQICPLVQAIIFGKTFEISHDKECTLYNPDLTNLAVPMKNLRTIILCTESYDFYLVEKFLTYTANVLGQDYSKQHITVHLYGPSGNLHPNLKNSFINMTKKIQQHPPQPEPPGGE
jgi:hypothetical protein